MERSMKHIEKIKRAIRSQHGCEAVHLRTKPVHQKFKGKTIWKGEVEVFSVDHATAKRCYGWTLDNADCVIVLELPPVHSAGSAVQVVLANATT